MSLDLGQAMRETMREVIREEVRAAFREERESRAPIPVSAPAMEPRLCVDDVVAACGGQVTPVTVRGWCKSGRLVAKKVGRGYLIEKAALERFLSVLQLAQTEAPDVDKEVARILAKHRG